MLRKIIHIDEEKCDGCGQCVPSCKEGALQIVEGKARLVKDSLCDGLGACLGECPRGAIWIEEREAADFDEAEVHRHLNAVRGPQPAAPHGHGHAHGHAHGGHGHGGCPGSAHRTLRPAAAAAPASDAAQTAPAASSLGQWPVQLNLVSPSAPFLQGADLLVCADCVPFAVADFHKRYLAGRAVVVGCPKLDDLQHYRRKLLTIFAAAQPRSLTVLRMEVPCCGGIAQAALEAWQQVRPDAPCRIDVIGIDGSIETHVGGAAEA